MNSTFVLVLSAAISKAGLKHTTASMHANSKLKNRFIARILCKKGRRQRRYYHILPRATVVPLTGQGSKDMLGAGAN